MDDPRLPSIRRCATDEDRRLCFRLRYDVYLSEQKKRYAADHINGELHDSLDPGSELLIAVTPLGMVVGTVRVTFCDHPAFPKELSDQLHLDALAGRDRASVSFTSRLVIAPGWRNTNLFRDLVCEAYRVGAPSSVNISLITCRRALVPLFTHLGYERYGEAFVDADAGLQQPMLIVPRDLDHLRRTASPFLALALDLPVDRQVRSHVDAVVREIDTNMREHALAGGER